MILLKVRLCRGRILGNALFRKEMKTTYVLLLCPGADFSGVLDNLLFGSFLDHLTHAIEL